ncbi:MAG TPA: DNA double-strand break repair nuclease NurA [Blastocatellia bacterium]|nr:DNA double-strand break repair nuclease NurA [Blastocatellia bacterium]
MLHRDKIIQQLQSKRDKFVAFEDSFQTEAGKYLDALDRMAMLSGSELARRLGFVETPGALPTAEFDAAPDLRVEFPPKWKNHQEAREWAFDTLIDHPTLAVDGSQIRPEDDFSVPVAAVQVAWFENRHASDGRYTKDARFEVLTPEDLTVEFNGDRVISEQQINLRRFELEIETLCETMESLAAEDGGAARLPVALFDSSLVISFADRLQGETQDRHIRAMLKLLRSSEKCGIPVVGYVDGSRARDLLHMIAGCFKMDDAEKIHDARLVDARLSWGERTPMFICARGGADRKQQGILEKFEEYSRGIGFVYLKTSATSPPARLEIPLWVLDQGLLNQVINLVIAEVVVGNGYPYVIQSADAAAVISSRDRDAFHAIFQRFAREQRIDLRIPQKAASKSRRRF